MDIRYREQERIVLGTVINQAFDESEAGECWLNAVELYVFMWIA